jgi:hypothetical protein
MGCRAQCFTHPTYDSELEAQDRSNPSKRVSDKLRLIQTNKMQITCQAMVKTKTK